MNAIEVISLKMLLSEKFLCKAHLHSIVLALGVSVLSLKHLFYMRAKSCLKEKSQSVFHFTVPLGKGDIVVKDMFFLNYIYLI